MNEDETLADRLLAIPDDAGRRAFLETHRPALSLSLIAALKRRAEETVLRDPTQAVAIAQAATDAAAAMGDPSARALARWAAGNVHFYRSEYQPCLEAYRAAQAFYEIQDAALEVARLETNQVYALTELGRHREAVALGEAARARLSAVTGEDTRRYQAALETNLGIAYRHLGEYPAAAASYARAEDLFRQLGDPVRVARAQINRANVLENQDRFREAGQLLDEARETLAREGARLPLTTAELNQAILAARLGHHRQALELFERARRGFMDLDVAVEVAVVDLYQARLYGELNLRPEAERLAQAAYARFQEHEMARESALAARTLAGLARQAHRFADALDYLLVARAFFVSQGALTEAALIDLEQALVQRTQGDPAAALALVQAAEAVFQAHEMPVRAAEARLISAGCYLDEGNLAAADVAYHAVESADLPALRWRVHYGLGRAAEQCGDLDEAATRYDAALDVIEALARELRLNELRGRFLDDKQAVYEAAVRLALRRGAAEAAFEYAERAKSGALAEFLAGALEALPAGEAPAALLERLRALREEWRWHQETLAHTDEHPETHERRGPTVRLREVETALGAAWRQARLVDPRYEVLTPGRPLTVADARGLLDAETALVSYYVLDGDVWAFLLAGDNRPPISVALSPLPSVLALAERLEFALESATLHPASCPLPPVSCSLPSTRDAEAHLHALYRRLWEPLAERLASYPRLIVVPHGLLYRVPFHALYDGVRYLVEDCTFAYLPGASLGRHLGGAAPAVVPSQAQRGRTWQPAAIFAHSDGGRLPFAVQEARQVSEVLGAPAWVEEAATRARLFEVAPGSRLVHLAVDGRLRADNPLFSALALADGPLPVEAIYDLDLSQAELAVLSACETGRGTVRGGEFLGLTQALFFAGARAAVVSLWRVDDAATACLMSGFYRELQAGRAVPEALRAAQLAAKQAYDHPYYWAPFVAVGGFRKAAR